MKCPRCHDVELVEGGALSSSTCAQCGGGLLPEEGLTLLLEEIKHTREQLRELAALYGGERIICPSCRSKMSPLKLRGRTVDLCFGCGSLWLDHGELFAISSGRHSLPVPTRPVPAVVAGNPSPAQALVRVDERTFGRHVLRAVLAGSGAVGVVWSLVGIMPGSSAVLGVAALGVSAVLSRREAFDVHPRARRMQRWRGWFAPDPRTSDGEPFSADSCVVVRRLRVLGKQTPWVVLDLVDAEGRTLTRLSGPLLPPRAWTEAPRYARALGVSVRFDLEPRADDAFDVEQAAAADLPAVARHDVLRLLPQTTARSRHMQVVGGDNTPLALVDTEIPLRGRPKNLDQLFAEHFVVHDASGDTLKLFSTVLLRRRATVLVGKEGKVFGHVAVKRSALGDTFSFSGPQGRRAASVFLRHGTLQAPIVDGYGRSVGVLETTQSASGDARPVTLHLAPGRLSGDARFGLLALALHASVVAAVPDVD